ncbi:MAG: PAS domain-containing protein [Hyphomicrobiales bacterium]|nr:PAS domain-containing protein [Hyphomicrobiales bacterium]
MTTLVPSVLLLLAAIYHHHESEVANIRQDALQLARAAAVDVDEVLENARRVLSRLSERSRIRDLDADRCDPIISELRYWTTIYANLSLIDRQGQVLCDAVGEKPVPSYADREWLPRAIASKAFTVGKPIIGKSTRLQVAPLVQPLVDESRGVIGFLSLALDLSRFKPTFARTGLPSGTEVSIVDSDGLLVATSQENTLALAVGRSLERGFVLEAMRHGSSTAQKIVHHRDDQMMEYMVAIVPVAGAGWSIVAAVPTTDLMDASRKGTIRSLAVIVALMVFASILALAGLLRAGRSVRSLAATVQAQLSGDTDRRADEAGPAELAAIGAAFNEMLDKQKATSERLRVADESLRRQAELLSAALQHMPQGVMMAGAGGRVEIVNDRYIEIYGLSREQAKPGCTFRDLVRLRAEAGTFSGNVDEYCDEVERAVRAGRVAHRITELPNGQVVHIANEPMPGGAWVSTHEDITAETLIEKEREQSRAFVNEIIENVPAGIMVKSVADRRILYMNRAGEHLWGISRGQAIGKMVSEVLPPAKAEVIKAIDDSVLSLDSVLDRDEQQNRGISSNGSSIASRHLVVRTPSGAPRYLMTVLEDTTERRRLEVQQAHTKAVLDKIIDEAPIAVFVKNTGDGKYVMINRAAEKYFGIERGEAIGRTSSDVLSPADAEQLQRLDREAIARLGEAVTVEQEVKSLDGRRRTSISKRICVADESGSPQYVFIFVQDLTERRQNEAALRQAQKMEAVGALTGGVAHDFNNLLTVIIGNLDLLKEEVADRPLELEKIDAVLDASLRGQELTRQMLAFSRRQPLRPTCVDLNELVAQTTMLLGRILGETVRIKVVAGAPNCGVCVDHAQLETALLNMAINSRDAMPHGGVLTMETGVVALDSKAVSNRPGLQPGEYAFLRITDTGTGIEPDKLGRIFEPFFTTKGPGQGTGLGLSMVYGFVKQSGGYIAVDSVVGEGTTFDLLFPSVQETTWPSDERDDAPVRSAPSSKKVVLVVDDQSAVRATAVAHLVSLGYEVLEADGASAALELLLTGRRVDLLLTDIVMPGEMDGLELAKQAKAARPALRVVYISGYPGEDYLNGAGIEAAEKLLAKPFRRRELADTVAAALAA